MLKKWFDHLSSHVTVWTWAWPGIASILGVGVVSGVVARATAWIEPWGPIGWWAAGLCGALLAGLLFVLFAVAYAKVIDARLKRRVYGSNDRLNPREAFFENKSIKIADLAYPFAPIVLRKTFLKCDLVGPCNIVLTGNTEITGCGGDINQAAIINLKANDRIFNAIVFHDCTIRECNVFQVTFLVQEDIYQRFSAGYRNLPWITKVP